MLLAQQGLGTQRQVENPTVSVTRAAVMGPTDGETEQQEVIADGSEGYKPKIKAEGHTAASQPRFLRWGKGWAGAKEKEANTQKQSRELCREGGRKLRETDTR